MLPGFRFLFAATVLSMSVLVFGLGAAALLRAAHEEVVSSALWRAVPEPKFTQQDEVPGEASREAVTPVLAMLRVEPEAAQQNAPDSIPAATAPAEPPAIAPVPDQPEQIAALKSQDSTPPEAAKPEIPVAEPAAPSEAAPADAPAPAIEQKIAAAEQTVALANDVTSPASGQASLPSAMDAGIAATKFATLGGPSVATGAQPTAKAAAKPDQSVAKHRLQARRAAERRRNALRARQAAAQQQAADPFGFTTRSR